MEVPDTISVTMSQPEKIHFTWSSLFSNSYYGETHDYVFGTKGTLMHDESDRVVYVPQGRRRADAKKNETESAAPGNGSASYRDSTVEHMQNFFDCVRSRKQTVCPFDMGFRSAIACQMAIASYRRQRMVRWDPKTEDIV
jgi:hypothetical protein